MYFELLHARLLDHLRGRVKSGELTERRLARLAGISQPHLHNVLKGVRVLSAATADVVVTNLRLSALDLLREEEMGVAARPATPQYREIPLAAGILGPDHAFPDLQESAGVLAFSAADLQGIVRPVAVRLAVDPEAPAGFRAGDIVLLEPLPSGSQGLERGGYYAIDRGGRGLLRRYQPADGGPADPVPAGVVRAKAIWIGRYLQARPEGAPIA